MESTTVPKSPARRAAKPTAVAGQDFYSPASYQTEESVAYLMRRLISNFAVEVGHELDPRGLTNAQWVPLYKLHLGHGTTAAELARTCELDAGSMTRMLDRLEAKNLIRRVRSSEDRRVVDLELTDEGRIAADQIPEALCKVLNAHLRGFSRDEVVALKSMLVRMLENGAAMQKDRDNT